MNTNDRTGGTFMPGPDAFEITDEKFNELFTKYADMIEETSIGQSSIPPVVSLYFRKIVDGMPGDVEGALIVIDSDFNDAEKKHRTMKKLGAACVEKEWILVAVMMSSEAWMSKAVDAFKSGMRPRNDPNREECIMIAGRTLMGECKRSCMIHVRRDNDNKFVKNGENIICTEVDTNLLDYILSGFRDAIGNRVRGK